MDLDDLVRNRRMCRNFLDRPVDPEVVNRLLDRARRAPSAGHTQGWAWLVLDRQDTTRRFWELDADRAWLASQSRPGLLDAPVILIPFSNPDAYRKRYSESDKAAVARPGGRPSPEQPGQIVEPGSRWEDGWPVPWWDVDTSFSIMLVLLGAVEEGLGALFFALHGSAEELRVAFAIPPSWRPLGAVALGWAAPDDTPSASAARGWKPSEEVVHRNSW